MADDRHRSEKVDKRQTERWYLVFYLRVFNGTSPEILGHLIDISEKGIKLICDSPIPVNKEYSLRMRLPNQMKERNKIIFSATSKWCKVDANPDFYLVGFQIDDLDSSTRDLVTALLRDFGQNGKK
jgi:hypothetical protein